MCCALETQDMRILITNLIDLHFMLKSVCLFLGIITANHTHDPLSTGIFKLVDMENWLTLLYL
jgi:hypothetical protein